MVRINYWRISLRHNLSRRCRKIVKFMSITHSERNIWNGPLVVTAISRDKRKPVLEGNGLQNTPIIYTHLYIYIYIYIYICVCVCVCVCACVCTHTHTDTVVPHIEVRDSDVL